MFLGHAPSRTSRFVSGLTLGYVHTVLLTLVGLWLTPYLLRHLGEHEYGLWLLGAQVLVYLGLMDIGVVALLPREVAYRIGRAGGADAGDLPRLVGDTVRVVLWQTPAVALAGLVVWGMLPAEWSVLGGPLALVVVTFVLVFPLRVCQALLQGLQDLAFLGSLHLTAWAVGVAVMVVSVEADLRLYSLAAGWMATQAVTTVLAWRRLVRHHPGALPGRIPALSLAAIRAQLGRGAWVSVSQVAQVLLGGTDLIVIGTWLGPAAIVPYACTAKLVLLLANQPQLFMQMAVPALSELRAGVSRDRLFRVSTGMSQVMLIGSGAIVCVTLAINEPFVTWWVGADRFGGVGLTLLLLVAMLLRHWNVAASYTLFSFGHERRLAITGVADGAITLLAMVALVPVLGASGAAVGSIVGICSVSLPNNLRALAREEGVPMRAALAPLGRWFVRCLIVAGVVAVGIVLRPIHGLLMLAVAGALAGGLYTAIMMPVLKTPPLGELLGPRLPAWMTSGSWSLVLGPWSQAARRQR